ncbi:hypothetical protein HF886_01550 [Rhodococcus sp. 105337]|nr:hypothetical protein [Rhodococcus sp. 105337]
MLGPAERLREVWRRRCWTNSISDTVEVMRSGDVVEYGTTTDIFDNPRHEYTKTLLDAIPGKVRHAR